MDNHAAHPAGLSATAGGYTLAVADAAPGDFAFRITGPDGAPVTAYEPQHDMELHLIVVRRDLSGYRHLHPALDATGTWHVASPFAEPGDYQVFADFKPAGQPSLTLGVGVRIPGDFTVRPIPEPADSTEVDGYTVTMDGELVAGQGAPVTFSIGLAGNPVTDLQPYLAAYGHLVALRTADLAYLHVHPQGEPGDGVTAAGPDIAFHAMAPSAGSYRLYLDFKHNDQVHTAEFTANAG